MATEAIQLPRNAKGYVETVVSARPHAIDTVSWQSLAKDVRAWDELAETASEPNPFFESWYLLPSLEAYDPLGKLRILRFEYDGKLAGVLPLARNARYYGKPIPHHSAWLHDNSFFGTPLVDAKRETEFWRAALDWADRHAETALFLHLPEMSLNGPVFTALQSVLSTHRRQAWIVQRGKRAVLSSPLDAESYRAQVLSSSRRKGLRRRMKRLEEIGEVRFKWQDDASAVELWCDQFLNLEASGWKGEEASAMVQDGAKRTIFNRSLAGAAKRGRLLRLALHLNGNPIAMLSTFVTPPGAFGYKTAFDEQYAKFAPGVLLENEFLSALDAHRFAWCDSGAASDHSLMNDLWRERRSIGKISIAIGGPLRRRIFTQLARLERDKTAIGANP